jgi:hypothetical protein
MRLPPKSPCTGSDHRRKVCWLSRKKSSMTSDKRSGWCNWVERRPRRSHGKARGRACWRLWRIFEAMRIARSMCCTAFRRNRLPVSAGEERYGVDFGFYGLTVVIMYLTEILPIPRTRFTAASCCGKPIARGARSRIAPWPICPIARRERLKPSG